MRRAVCGLMRIVRVAEVGVSREGGKDQRQQPVISGSNGKAGWKEIHGDQSLPGILDDL
jgi:hypothetical protein